jgi:Fe-S cluster assembly protein SufD
MPQRSELNQEVLYEDNLPVSLSFEVPEKGSLKLKIAAFRPLNDTVINVNVGENGKFEGAFADFSSSKYHFILNVYLKGRGASCDWHLAAVAKKDNTKLFETSVYHEAPETVALMSNYGIGRDESKLTFTGVSEIKNGSKKTQTRQVAKIIVFDPKSDGLASPILKIGDNDVEASHAAVVGRLNEEHLFYLESRGLDEEAAKRLITLGYLKPIEQYFSEDTLAKKIDDAIEGGI